MPAPTLTASTSIITGSSTTTVSDSTGITPAAGGAMQVGVDLPVSGRVITVTDDQGNSYSEQQNQDNGSLEVAVFRAFNCANALTKVTVSVDGAATTIGFVALAWSGPDATDTQDGVNNASTTSHPAADPGLNSAIDWAGLAVWRVGSALNATGDPSGWTRIGSGSALRFYYYQSSATALSGDTVTLTVASNRTGPAAVATIKDTPASIAQPPRTMHQFRQRA